MPERPHQPMPLVHGPLRLGEVDDRQRAREDPPRAWCPDLCPGRGQPQTRPEHRPRVHRRRPGREHPPGREVAKLMVDAGVVVLLLHPRSGPSVRWPGCYSRTVSSSRSLSTPCPISQKPATPRASTRRHGEIPNFTGISPLRAPQNPDTPGRRRKSVEEQVR